MSLADTYRDAFLALLKQGKSHLEAFEEFELRDFNLAMLDELKHGRREGMPSLLELAAIANREQMNSNDMDKAIELWLAGWVSLTPHKCQQNIMSWYWRRPPIRKRKMGRLFLSTDQAFNALKKC